MEDISLSGVLEVLAFAGTMITVYIKIQIKIKEIEMNIMRINEKMTFAEKQDDKILERLDKIFDEITTMKIELIQKADKETA